MPNRGVDCDRLGIVLVASPGDWLFAKGAIASCQYFMPFATIQLLIDGDIDCSLAEQHYNVLPFRAKDIDSAELRRLGFGWGTTKLLAFWYSVTEHFLYLDSDAVLWGDLTHKLDLTNLDYLVSLRKQSDYSDTDIASWFFEISFVERHFPDWNWRTSAPEFFCPGVFAARRGAFDLDDYLRILKLNERNPGKFKFGDMGFHNLMVFRGRDCGRLRVDTREFQVIFPEHTKQHLQARFAFDNHGTPIVAVGDEQVLHMPDQKPLVDNPNCYSQPMTFFRLKYLEQTEGITGELALMRLRQEDNNYHCLRADFLRRQKRQKFIKLLQGHPGYWGQLCKRLLRFK